MLQDWKKQLFKNKFIARTALCLTSDCQERHCQELKLKFSFQTRRLCIKSPGCIEKLWSRETSLIHTLHLEVFFF